MNRALSNFETANFRPNWHQAHFDPSIAVLRHLLLHDLGEWVLLSWELPVVWQVEWQYVVLGSCKGFPAYVELKSSFLILNEVPEFD